MTISFEDAWGLLSKWKSESTYLSGIVMTEGAAVTFGGSITDLRRDAYALVVSHYLSPGKKAVEVLVGLAAVTRFEFEDLREAPPDIRESLAGKISAFLAMDLPTGKCCLYERESQ